ncbi:MAG: DUF1902 domain-containing protein [Parvibaculum sp.]|uniref:DUF1902 domain-containing protein n=1 Tax=Parvibaculum sp. TaxID=2024848 RepID=UPI0032EF2DAB
MPQKELVVRAQWDEEAKVWFVVESDIPGLAAEGATVEELEAKLRVIVPELASLNRHLMDAASGGDISVHLKAERLEKYSLA